MPRSAERSVAGCTIKLNKEPVEAYVESSVVLMKNMIADIDADARTLAHRIGQLRASHQWPRSPLRI